jgi:hypothetical protein
MNRVDDNINIMVTDILILHIFVSGRIFYVSWDTALEHMSFLRYCELSQKPSSVAVPTSQNGHTPLKLARNQRSGRMVRA